jgi:hypothetical protein
LKRILQQDSFATFRFSRRAKEILSPVSVNTSFKRTGMITGKSRDPFQLPALSTKATEKNFYAQNATRDSRYEVGELSLGTRANETADQQVHGTSQHRQEGSKLSKAAKSNGSRYNEQEYKQ